MGVQIGGGMLLMKYSRSDEAQADAVGAIILYRSGYDPEALARFFNKLNEESGGSRGPQFLSDHPNPGNREQAIEKQIERWPPKQYRTSNSAFNQARKHAQSVQSYTAQEIADGAKSGRWAELNRRSGAVFKAPPGVQIQQNASQEQGGGGQGPSGPVSHRDVAPSSQMVNEKLGPINIARPENWEVMGGQQQGQGVTIAPRAGVAGNGIGYGVVINGVQPQNSGDIDQVTDNIVRSLQNGGGDLHQISDAQAITVNGARGRSVMMESTSPFTTSGGSSQKERDWLVTAPQPDGSVVFFVFVAPSAEFEGLRPTFNEMLRSVRFSN
jgi:hypothetical protein